MIVPSSRSKPIGISLGGQPILQHGRCSVVLSTPGSTTGDCRFCVFALTADALHVEAWSAASLKYEEIVRVDLPRARSVALETFLRNAQV